MKTGFCSLISLPSLTLLVTCLAAITGAEIQGHLHVYKLIHNGLDVYHTGIEVFGREYYFEQDGKVYSTEPRGHNDRFHKTVTYTTKTKTEQQVRDELRQVIGKFSGSRYDFFGHNCNSFSNAVTQRIFGEGIGAEYLNQGGGLQGIAERFPGSSTFQELFKGEKGKYDQALENDLRKFPGGNTIIDAFRGKWTPESFEKDFNRLPLVNEVTHTAKKIFKTLRF